MAEVAVALVVLAWAMHGLLAEHLWWIVAGIVLAVLVPPMIARGIHRLHAAVFDAEEPDDAPE